MVGEKIIYYEAHITLPESPIVDMETINKGDALGFHYSIIDGDGDVNAVILTTRDKSYETLKARMVKLMSEVDWARYKVEAIVVDSKVDEEWGLRSLEHG